MGYIFDPKKLHEIGRKAVGLPREEMVRVVIDETAKAYPGHVATKQDWIFSIAGGITGIMNVLHGSLTEYVLIFGTATGTDGFSGRYHLDIWDVVLAGEMKTYTEKTPLEPRLYKPGDLALLERGKVKACWFSEGNWMLEYARGAVPTSLPFAVMTSHDPRTIMRTAWIYGKQVLKELMKGKI